MTHRLHPASLSGSKAWHANGSNFSIPSKCCSKLNDADANERLEQSSFMAGYVGKKMLHYPNRQRVT